MPLNIAWQQILLHALNFVILFAGLYFLLYRPVKAFMKKRREHYESMDAAAADKTKRAEELKASYEEKLAAADEEIAEKSRRAKAEADEAAAQIRQAAEAQAQAIVEEARASAAREKERMERGARGEIAAIVTQATEKIVLHDSASEAYDAFLNAAEKNDE